MGICPLQPQQRVVNEKNRAILESIRTHLSELNLYGFSSRLLAELPRVEARYLYSLGLLEDLEKLESYVRSSYLKRESSSVAENLDEEIRNSCLILENEGGEEKDPTESFQNNMKENKSLVMQIDILYSREINRAEYSQALRLFLKWAQLFQEHSYGGFLKPLYIAFCNYLYALPLDDFPAIVDEVAVFVQLMVRVVSEVYGLHGLAATDLGKLVKNENVYNLIMSTMFKRTKLRKFLLRSIAFTDGPKVDHLHTQILRFANKPASFFGLSPKFALQDGLSESELNRSTEEKQAPQPYSESLKLVSELCKSGTTPITKLKTIITISRQISKDIQAYYDGEEREAPDLDPDSLSSIVMYLIVRNGSKEVYQELKIVENFTTANCLNCISGYYLNVFSAAVESILAL